MAGRQKSRQVEVARKRREESKLNLRSLHALKWQDADALSEAIERYFADCDSRQASYTIAGLALWLGFARRESISDYCGRTDELGEVMWRARLRIEQQRSEQLVENDGAAPVGKIFDLKCNFGWQEPPQRQEINNPDGNVGTKVVAMLPERPLTLEEWQRWYEQMMSKRPSQREGMETQEACYPEELPQEYEGNST